MGYAILAGFTLTSFTNGELHARSTWKASKGLRAFVVFFCNFFPAYFNLLALVTMALLESVFNHLVLPPKLPGQQDRDIEVVEQNILTRLIRACDSLGELTGQQFAGTWAPVGHSLRVCLNTNLGRLEKASILQAFGRLQPKDLFALHVVEQNAALLIRRHIK
ncbi:MAG: hypothetical protein CL912_29985 [Deltaproteobacteria bacterium]|nr:hypothetical protein [Deltaproteobacteria bacterium]